MEDIRGVGFTLVEVQVEVWDMDELRVEELALGEGTRSYTANLGQAMGSGILRFP